MHCLSKEADLGIPACMTIDECCLYNNFQKFVALNKSLLVQKANFSFGRTNEPNGP